VKRKLPEALGDALFLAERLRAKGLVLGSYTVEEVPGAARHSSGRFWDALIAYTYLSHGVKAILTENVEDSKGLIEALNPFEEAPEGRAETALGGSAACSPWLGVAVLPVLAYML